ncbi:unnamed protein product [Schistosoma mattheei]|uniref:Uncharacterized protein n=1 Tax=Schistosoma mattheei TaxID=31246 RepID=A0A183P3L1_9TREM|nr:unnamed protein product [Schistosoma mattheei]
MIVEGIQQVTLGLGFVPFGTHQWSVPVILRELMLPDGFILVSPGSQSKTLALGYPGHDCRPVGLRCIHNVSECEAG